jgi:hypothetical protein
MDRPLSDLLESLLLAEDFHTAFAIFQEDILASGVDGVLYTYIPQPFLDNRLSSKPIYHMSDGFSVDHLIRFARERHARQGLLTGELSELGEETVDCVDWLAGIWETSETQYTSLQECIDVPLDAVKHSVTVTLMSDGRGVAGANFTYDSRKLHDQLDDHLNALKLKAKMFHCLVLSNSGFMSEFVKPWAESFNPIHLNYIRGLIEGKKTFAIAYEMGTSQGYMEQILVRLRRKLSGVGNSESPTISRNQILYYAGLLNLLEGQSGGNTRQIQGSNRN